MTEPGNGKPLFFKVECSGQILQNIQRLHDKAIAAGKGEVFVAALAAIHDRLRRDPRSFGEPLYRLPALRLSVRVAIVAPLVVNFGVHEEKLIVFIKGIDDMGLLEEDLP